MCKRVRKRAVIAGSLVFACAFALTGCTKEEQETKVVVESEGQMEGTLVSFEGKTLIAEEAGEEYTYDVSNAQIQTRNMRAGDELVIYFEGKLEGTDTSEIKVTEVDDLGDNGHQTEKQAVGTLVNLTENTVTIRQNDGTEFLFSSNNCRHEFKNGIREGNWIVVTYIGEINGTDTKNVTVIKITDNDANTVKKEQKKMKIKAVNETVYATAGVHIREAYTTDSKVLGSLAKGKSVLRTGVCENGWSRVQYKSRDAYIYGEYLTKEKPKKEALAAKIDGNPPATMQAEDEPKPVRQLAGEEKPAGQQEEPVKLKEQSFTGTVLDVSMNTLTVEDGGQEFTLYIADAEHEYANGIQTGNTVTVTYVGNLNDPDNLIVIKVQDSDPNEAAKNAVYTGVIIDATMNTLTLRTEDGAVMTFIKDGAVNNLDDTMNDQEVKITADMTASEADENIYQAKQIDPAD